MSTDDPRPGLLAGSLDERRIAALDAADPLAPFRDRFVVPDDALVYLDGNSLGRLPRETPARLAELVERQWGDRLIRSWTERWMELPQRVGDLIGAELLGAAPGQVSVADSTTVCFHKLAAAALAARPGRDEIVTDVDNFPTDRYVLEGLAQQHGATIRWLDADPSPEAVAAAVGPRTALVTFSHVAYRSGRILELEAITRIAHAAGALALWDLSHSAGSVPVGLDAAGADLAVGCTYKYLNGGPGAPAYLYVAKALQGRLTQPIWGWIGRRDPFSMGSGYEPAAGIAAFLSGTPPVLGLTAVEVGVRLVAEAGIERIRAKGIALTELATELAEAWLAPLGVAVQSPRDPARRGAHVALAHPDSARLCERLADAGVIVDFRAPTTMRLGLSPLTTRFADVWNGVAVLRDLMEESP